MHTVCGIPSSKMKISVVMYGIIWCDITVYTTELHTVCCSGGANCCVCTHDLQRVHTMHDVTVHEGCLSLGPSSFIVHVPLGSTATGRPCRCVYVSVSVFLSRSLSLCIPIPLFLFQLLLLLLTLYMLIQQTDRSHPERLSLVRTRSTSRSDRQTGQPRLIRSAVAAVAGAASPADLPRLPQSLRESCGLQAPLALTCRGR